MYDVYLYTPAVKFRFTGNTVAALDDVAVLAAALAEASDAAHHGPEDAPSTPEIVSPVRTLPAPIVIAAPATIEKSAATPKLTESTNVEAFAEDAVVARLPIRMTGTMYLISFANEPCVVFLTCIWATFI
jgi:hypothetical protein